MSNLSIVVLFCFGLFLLFVLCSVDMTFHRRISTYPFLVHTANERASVARTTNQTEKSWLLNFQFSKKVFALAAQLPMIISHQAVAV